MPIPPRVHIFLARESPQALILRREPTNWTCTIGWNRADDTFELGQWVKARINPRKCDISPDGKQFIYFAYTTGSHTHHHEMYTAISRTPYLKAIGLWPHRTMYDGGGEFLSNDEFCIVNEHSRYEPEFEPVHPRLNRDKRPEFGRNRSSTRDGERHIWVANGVLYASKVGPQGIVEEKQLYDLNPMKPERRLAPY